MHRLPVRVYYEDTDAGGVVYHANYLKFFERARTEWLRAMGIEQDWLRDTENLIFVVRGMEIDFQRPARFNDGLETQSEITQVGRASLIMRQTLHRQEQLLCAAEVRLAVVHATHWRPCRLPTWLGEKLSAAAAPSPGETPCRN